MRVLIPHGASKISPRGIGLNQDITGLVFATTPCCGEKFVWERSRQKEECSLCLADYTQLERDLDKNLAFDFRPEERDLEDSYLMNVYNYWLQAITGNPFLEVTW